MRMRIITPFLCVLINAFIQNCSSGSARPTVETFEITSSPVTSDEVVNFTFEATDDVEVTGWLVNESAEIPEPLPEESWLSEVPSGYRLSEEYGEKTLYAWVKDADNQVSESKSFTVTYVATGTEDATNWNLSFDSGAEDTDIPYGIAIDSGNHVYVVGRGIDLVEEGSGTDWWLKKFSSQGVEDTENWNQCFDHNNGNDSAYAVAIDSEDNVIVAGVGVDLEGSTGMDWWIKKFSSDGVEDTTDWNISLDGGASEHDLPAAVSIDGNDAVIVVGTGQNLESNPAKADPASQTDWLVVKFSSEGSLLWQNKYDEGYNHDGAEGVVVDSLNRIYVAGYGDSDRDGVVKKYSSDGGEISTDWPVIVDFSSGDEWIWDIAIDRDDHFYVGGTGESLAPGSTMEDGWVKKFDTDGNEITTGWNKAIQPGDDVPDEVVDIEVDRDGNVYVLGISWPTMSTKQGWLKVYDANGVENTTDWNKTFDVPAAQPNNLAMALDSYGHVYIIGITENSVTDSSGTDWWIRKFING